MYSFTPMMPFYDRFVLAPTDWLMSQDGRTMIAKSIRYCRNRFGRQEARIFRNALTCAGCIYPLIREYRNQLAQMSV